VNCGTRYNRGRKGLLNRYRLDVEIGRSAHPRIRVLGAIVAGVLALTAPIAADADAAALGSSAGPVNTGRTPVIVQVGMAMVPVGIIRCPIVGVVAGT
jgi:hypothetical protein